MQWLERLFEKVLSLLPSVVIVEPTERGARVTGGKRYRIIGPGWYFVWPVVQYIVRMDVVTQVVDLPPQTVTTKDGHCLVVSGTIRYHIVDIEKALFAVQDVDKALSTLALGVILEAVQAKALVDCGDVEALKRELRKGVAEAASGWGLKIEQVYLTDLGRVRSLRLFGDNMRMGTV
jgi:regulator of protease activity HflC (stomatin/prohibitin superfamily)